MNKKIFLLFILPISLIIINCNGNIYPQFEKNPKEGADLLKFDLLMSQNTSKIWAAIRIFELSKQNMPINDEGLKIKSCVSQFTSSFLEETINNDLMHLESEYNNTYKSTDSDLNKAMLEYIVALTDFTNFVAEKYKNTEFTIETPIHKWEEEILFVDKNDAPDSISGKLSQAIDTYGYFRNTNIGPIGPILKNYSDHNNQPIMIHHMKNLAIKITGVKSLKDSDNIDYYFYESNKKYIFNHKLCNR